MTSRDLGAYRTRALFAWRRDEWPGLNWWMLALKQKDRAEFWREPALWIIEAFGSPPGDAVLVPVPSSRARNHAFGFARELGRRADVEVRDALEPRSTHHQRRLGRDARRARRYQLKDDSVRFDRVIVIDDVITSGATIEAAFRALGQPARFEAWCLADRRPPGDRSGVG